MTRTATLDACPRCQSVILATSWDPVEAMQINTVRADPIDITPDVETVCIILDRPTYAHQHTATGHHLRERDARWHRYHHGGTPHHTLPAHRCGTKLPGTPLNLTPPTNAPQTPDSCPF